MSGNIKYIGKNKTVIQLPTSGFGFSVSNSDGTANALKKFASSFTDNKTKASMINNFTSDNTLVNTITENVNNSNVLNNVLHVEQTPLNNKDCSVFTVSKKPEGTEHSRESDMSDSRNVIEHLTLENQQLLARNNELEIEKNTLTASIQTRIQYLTSEYESDKNHLTVQLNREHETQKVAEINKLKEELQLTYEIQKNELIRELTEQIQTGQQFTKLLEKTSEIQEKGAEIRNLTELNILLEERVRKLSEQKKPAAEILENRRQILNELIKEQPKSEVAQEADIVESKAVSAQDLGAVVFIMEELLKTVEEEAAEPLPLKTLREHSPFFLATNQPTTELNEESAVDSLVLPTGVKGLDVAHIEATQHLPNTKISSLLNNIMMTRQQESFTLTRDETSTRQFLATMEELHINIEKLREIIPTKTVQPTTPLALPPLASETKKLDPALKEIIKLQPQKSKNVANPKENRELSKDDKKKIIQSYLGQQDNTFSQDFKDELREKIKNNNVNEAYKSLIELAKKKQITELALKTHGIPTTLKIGGKSRRHGKRLKSRKPRAFKNKTKTRRYRKRSFTRRRK